MTVEKAVNDFAKSNHDFVNEYQNLQKEIAKREREILNISYKDQEKARKELNNTINQKNKAFVDKYGKSFAILNSSNKQILTTLEKQVNEFDKNALDRSFVDAYKAMQEKITEMQFQTIMTPVKESEQAQQTMQAKIQSLYAEFTSLYKSQFENLNEANKNTLMQIAEQAKKTSKSLFDRLLESLSGFIDKAVNKDLGKSVVESPAKGAENLMGSMLDISKDVMKSFGPWGAIAAATLDFAIGIFEGLEQQRIKEIEERRDKDLIFYKFIYPVKLNSRLVKIALYYQLFNLFNKLIKRIIINIIGY